VLLQRAFVETIASGRDIKPWSWADTWPVGRIELKRLRASAIVLAVRCGDAGAGTLSRACHPDRGCRVTDLCLKDVAFALAAQRTTNKSRDDRER
jgi:hypothetical protein